MKHHAAGNYRADIDGLRAMAIIPVVLFHFHSKRLGSGGFIGVDIFFVISGFLITRLIFEETVARNFSLTAFYGRRIRRIMPALFVMILFCLVCTVSTGFPGDVTRLSKYIFAAIFSVSNIAFYLSSSYFDAAMSHIALLHTWSLAVEEQFYLCFPLLMIALANRSHRVRVCTIGMMAACSLLWSIFLVKTDPTAAFYLLPSRAWELLIGALIAIGAVPSLSGTLVCEAASLSGFALIVGSIHSLSVSTPFPGLAALPACVGTGLVIHAGSSSRTVVSRLLSSSPLRFVGAISYSLYLWHWPLYVFYCDVVRTPLGTEKILLMASCVVVAWLSYRFIETPFRRERRTVKAAVIAVPALCAATFYASANASSGTLPSQITSALSFSNYEAAPLMRAGQCFLVENDGHADRFFAKESNIGAGGFDTETCLKPEVGKTNVLLMGDSHAADLWAGFGAARPDLRLLQATGTGCLPVIGAVGWGPCANLMRYMFTHYLPSQHPDVIVLSARWEAKDADAVAQTARYLTHYAARVVVLGPTPEYDQILPRLLARSLVRNDASILTNHLRGEQLQSDAVFARTIRGEGVVYVSAYQWFCNPRCRVWADRSTPMYFDGDHLTVKGAQVMAEGIGAQLFGAR